MRDKLLADGSARALYAIDLAPAVGRQLHPHLLSWRTHWPSIRNALLEELDELLHLPIVVMLLRWGVVVGAWWGVVVGRCARRI